MRRPLLLLLVAACFALLAPATASAQQSINLFIGGFTPRSLDARGTDDVLFKDSEILATFNQNVGIDVSEFNNVTLGGEWLVGLGNNLEGSLGLGFYSRSVPTSYANFTDQQGNEIDQDLKLRVVPFSATVRFLPFGRRASVVPYVGAGVGVFAWRYSETGRFVDFTDNSIYQATFVGSGSATGPVVLGGVRLPVGDWSIGGEIRYQSAKGDLSTQDFLGPKIDLGGMNYLLTVGFKF